jgi:hypothetical protein
MTYSSGLSPNAVKTALDDIWEQEYTGQQHPNHADATTPDVFRQENATNSAVIMEVFKGVGAWSTRAEEQDIPEGNPRIANQKTFTVTNYSNAVPISKNFFDDNMHSSYEMMIRSFARRARTTRDSNAFAVFRNAFSSATTADGVALISDSHTNLNGDTVDNNVGAALSETTLFTAIQQLLEMKAQDGVIDGSLARTLLVAPAKYKLACEINNSSLRSGTANNDINVYESKYGIKIYTSPYLGAQQAGGSDSAWFVLGDNHSIMRFVRQAVQTALVDWTISRNNNYVYKGEFREVVGAMSFEGIVGSAT